MSENKIIKLFHNEDFIEKFKNINTKEDFMMLLKNNGVDIDNSNEDYLKEICERYVEGNEIIDDEQLNNVVAGTDYVKISMNLGEKLGALGALASDYCKSFANSCRKGYNDMALKLEEDKNKNV